MTSFRFSSKLLWQYGDRHYQAGRWDVAVDWFLGGTHQLFRGFSEGTMKCYRKAALCHIQQREYASAAAVVRLCPGNEAATHYIGLLASVKQGISLFIMYSISPAGMVSYYPLWFRPDLIRVTLPHRIGGRRSVYVYRARWGDTKPLIAQPFRLSRQSWARRTLTAGCFFWRRAWPMNPI